MSKINTIFSIFGRTFDKNTILFKPQKINFVQLVFDELFWKFTWHK